MARALEVGVLGFSRFLAPEDRLKARHQPVTARSLAKFAAFGSAPFIRPTSRECELARNAGVIVLAIIGGL